MQKANQALDAKSATQAAAIAELNKQNTMQQKEVPSWRERQCCCKDVACDLASANLPLGNGMPCVFLQMIGVVARLRGWLLELGLCCAWSEKKGMMETSSIHV